MEFSKALDKLGDTAITREDEEDDIGAAFQKFAVVTKELSALMKNMVSQKCFYHFLQNFCKNAAEFIIQVRNVQNLISFSKCCHGLIPQNGVVADFGRAAMKKIER